MRPAIGCRPFFFLLCKALFLCKSLCIMLLLSRSYFGQLVLQLCVQHSGVLQMAIIQAWERVKKSGPFRLLLPQKPIPLKTPHDFFLITPGNSTSFLMIYPSWKFLSAKSISLVQIFSGIVQQHISTTKESIFLLSCI